VPRSDGETPVSPVLALRPSLFRGLPGKIGKKDRKIDCYYTKNPYIVKKISGRFQPKIEMFSLFSKVLKMRTTGRFRKRG
jgi:hypothetical protein